MHGVELPLEIAEALQRGATVVTSNQRAARALRRGFDRTNRSLGLASWAPASVRAWDTWMAALWHGLVIEGKVTQLLLNPTQEHAVWRAILQADKELASLWTPDSLAEMAADTWRLLCRYEGQRRLRNVGGNTDARAFQQWAQSFERRCRAEGFLAPAQLEEALHAAAEKELLELPAGGVLLVGFDEMTPAQTRLIEALRSAGVDVVESRPERRAAQRVLVAAPNEREELHVAARWIRGFLEKQPTARVAVIVPGLETQRNEIDRIFREVLAPELENIQAGDEAGPYEFSLGIALATTPMAATALDILRWTAGALPLEVVSRLLLSPHFATASEERGARAEFDAFELRKMRKLQPNFSLDDMVAAVNGWRHRGKLSRLMIALRAMRAVANRLQGMTARTHAEWSHEMRELLKAAAWGAGAQETSVMFQLRRKWESALDELATLDFDGLRVDFTQALQSLERIAQQTTFSPESHDAPVQVMGPLEAAGGTFDAVWFLRGGELTWPVAPTTSFMLPWPLKRELRMPGTDIARDSEYARRMTERIVSTAETVVFSFANESAEGRQRSTPLLAGLDFAEVSVANLVGAATQSAVVELEEIEDVARVRPLPNRTIRGGAAVLQLQAACGFRAFAEKRLWATEPESVAPGMDARESGNVVHDALKLFWDEIHTQHELRSMTIAARDKVLDRSIAEAMKRTGESIASAWDVAYIEVQRKRLHRLLSWWLDLESQRAPFTVKLSEKEFKDVSVGPLQLSVRMDRVDEVEGGEVLIDYKTGGASPSDWLSERPDAPQLPLYAILSEPDRLRAVAFGLVRAGEERKLKGYAAEDGILPGRLTKITEAENFAGQIERWRQVLVALAEEFYAGDARVHPKRYPATCQYCEQRILCRLNVSALEEEEDANDATDEASLD